jgi:hypothetical protein
MIMQGLAIRSALAITCALVLVTSLAAQAQQASAPPASPAKRDMPRPDELEPGVDTTKSPPPTAPAASEATSEPRAAVTAPPAAAPPAASATTSAGAASTANTPAAKSTKAKSGPDRLELGATDVRGNSELPTVMYVVPWKRSDLGDLVGKPANSLVDEVLQPLDRDVFRRENRYYEAVKPEGAGAKSDAVQGSGAKP